MKSDIDIQRDVEAELQWDPDVDPLNITVAVKDGVVTPQGIAELRTRMPHADVEKFSKNPKVENIQELFTVQMIVNFLQTKLAGGAA